MAANTPHLRGRQGQSGRRSAVGQCPHHAAESAVGVQPIELLCVRVCVYSGSVLAAERRAPFAMSGHMEVEAQKFVISQRA